MQNINPIIFITKNTYVANSSLDKYLLFSIERRRYKKVQQKIEISDLSIIWPDSYIHKSFLMRVSKSISLLSYVRCKIVQLLLRKISAALLYFFISYRRPSNSPSLVYTFVGSFAVIFLQYSTEVATLHITYLGTYIYSCC